MNIDKLYDLIWAKADRLIKQYNPCNIRYTDNGLRCNNACMVKDCGNDLCCGGCKWLDKKIGCTVKSVGCKVGTCWEGSTWYDIFEDDLSLINIPDTFITQMDRLRKIAFRYNLSAYRMSKEETLKWRLHNDQITNDYNSFTNDT